MKVAILYDRIAEQGGSPDQRDVLEQAEAVGEALVQLGHETATLTFSLDVKGFIDSIKELQPDLVFNLVESVEGHGKFIYMAAAVLDHLGFPYTGAPTDVLYVTTNKLLTKRVFRASGIPTPQAFSQTELCALGELPSQPYVIKSVWEHASVGLDEDSVVFAADPNLLVSEMARRREKLGGESFAEAYIEGREFSLSLLGGGKRPEVLPPAEIRFVNYPPGKWKVVGYRAKWKEASFEYQRTVRSFQFNPEDQPLLHQLKRTAEECWSLFILRGYARVDFRVDEEKKPWVLEVNANPCLSRDAGFFAAATQAGLSYKDMIQRIIEDSR